MWSAHTEGEFTHLHMHNNNVHGKCFIALIQVGLYNGTSSFKLLCVANRCLLRMMHVLLTHHDKAVCVGRMDEYARAHCAVTEHCYCLTDVIRV